MLGWREGARGGGRVVPRGREIGRGCLPQLALRGRRGGGSGGSGGDERVERLGAEPSREVGRHGESMGGMAVPQSILLALEARREGEGKRGLRTPG